MDRLACVNVSAFPLQLLLARHPEWRGAPVAVVAEEKAQSPLLWVNGSARRGGLRAGMRHAAALSLVHDLRAAAVSPAEVAAGVKALVGCLQRHSPHVEPSRQEPGVFWSGAGGLRFLHPDLSAWAGRMMHSLAAEGFGATVVVGFSRFGSYAVARGRRGIALLDDPEREREIASRVPLERLGVEPGLRDDLEQLGIRTLAALLRLPAVGLLQRFGPEVYRLHRLAAGLLQEAFQPDPEELPIEERVVLDYPESDAVRLLFLIKSPVQSLLARLGKRREALGALHLRLLQEGGAPRETVVKPAAPSRDIALILDLVRLRLESLRLEAGATEIELLAQGEPRELERLSLFAEGPKRDLAAGNRALARVRAEFGEAAVVRARLREAHLPEGGFAWERLERMAAPVQPRPPAAPPGAGRLVRRLFSRPRPLAAPAEIGAVSPGALHPDVLHPGALYSLGRALAAQAGFQGPLVRLHGPYPISGGWWTTAQHRDYYFAESERGEVYWIYRDRPRRRWFLQGRME